MAAALHIRQCIVANVHSQCAIANLACGAAGTAACQRERAVTRRQAISIVTERRHDAVQPAVKSNGRKEEVVVVTI